LSPNPYGAGNIEFRGTTRKGPEKKAVEAQDNFDLRTVEVKGSMFQERQ
jgi:hypothetical protein